jgi:hypothetical protein
MSGSLQSEYEAIQGQLQDLTTENEQPISTNAGYLPLFDGVIALVNQAIAYDQAWIAANGPPPDDGSLPNDSIATLNSLLAPNVIVGPNGYETIVTNQATSPANPGYGEAVATYIDDIQQSLLVPPDTPTTPTSPTPVAYTPPALPQPVAVDPTQADTLGNAETQSLISAAQASPAVAPDPAGSAALQMVQMGLAALNNGDPTNLGEQAATDSLVSNALVTSNEIQALPTSADDFASAMDDVVTDSTTLTQGSQAYVMQFIAQTDPSASPGVRLLAAEKLAYDARNAPGASTNTDLRDAEYYLIGASSVAGVSPALGGAIAVGLPVYEAAKGVSQGIGIAATQYGMLITDIVPNSGWGQALITFGTQASNFFASTPNPPSSPGGVGALYEGLGVGQGILATQALGILH